MEFIPPSRQVEYVHRNNHTIKNFKGFICRTVEQIRSQKRMKIMHPKQSSFAIEVKLKLDCLEMPHCTKKSQRCPNGSKNCLRDRKQCFKIAKSYKNPIFRILEKPPVLNGDF